MMKKTNQNENEKHEGEGKDKEKREGNEEKRSKDVSRKDIPREQADKSSDTILILPMPFLQRLKKANDDAKFIKFVKFFKICTLIFLL